MSRIRDEILQESSISEGTCWAMSKGSENRLDIRFSEGVRTSVIYHSIQKIDYYKEGTDSGLDLLVIEIPGVSRFEIAGKHLLSVYEALNRQTVSFLAVVNGDEDYEVASGVIIDEILEYSAEEIAEQKSSVSSHEESDHEAILAYIESLSDDEAGELTDEAYRLAREDGDLHIDELSELGDLARWEAFANFVRRKMSPTNV